MNTTPIDHKIEFRGISKETNCFVYGNLILLKSGIDLEFEEFAIVDFLNLKEFAVADTDYHRIIAGTESQLTALRTINDEPIYNHMIVKNQNVNHFLVDMFDYTKMYYLYECDLQIVGNRFQHPELLELCK